MGNAIALPLQGLALKSGNSAFVDESWTPYVDQLKLLAGTKRLTKREVENYISAWYGKDNKSKDDIPWDKDSVFDSAGITEVVQIVLSDNIYIYAASFSNKLKRQLRRLATFSNRQYYQNYRKQCCI